MRVELRSIENNDIFIYNEINRSKFQSFKILFSSIGFMIFNIVNLTLRENPNCEEKSLHEVSTFNNVKVIEGK